MVVKNFINKSNLEQGYIYKKERRTKTPGQIKRLIERRERLEANRNQFTREIIISESIAIERLLQQILSDIEPSERASVRKLLGEEAPALPPFEAPRVMLPPNRDEQFAMPLNLDLPELEILPDYVRRFRLSDGPN